MVLSKYDYYRQTSFVKQLSVDTIRKSCKKVDCSTKGLSISKNVIKVTQEIRTQTNKFLRPY